MMAEFNKLSRTLAHVKRRDVVVHGAAYAAFVAANQIFGNLVTKGDMDQFAEFLERKCETLSNEGIQQVNVMQFFSDLVALVRIGAFGDTVPDLRRFFCADCVKMEHAPGAANKDAAGDFIQGPWETWTLYIEPRGLFEIMRKNLRQGGREMSLGPSDMREQISGQPYFVTRIAKEAQRKEAREKSPVMRFAGVAMVCWGVQLDQFPELGYRPISDEELLEARFKRRAPGLPGADAWIPNMDWDDPRKGALYAIVEALKEKEK